jgi:broad specificity phosphatase PhoE
MIYVVRHATAGDPNAWIGDDRARPLDERGRGQTAALVELLAERPFARVLTSPYLRCVETIEPLARARRLPLEYRHELGDDAGPQEALALLRELGGEPVAVCSHGDLIRELIGAELEKGAVAIAEVTPEGLTLRDRLGPAA